MWDQRAARESREKWAVYRFAEANLKATLMLEGGADIRYIQQMLGHSNLESTQVYTQVSIRNLQQIHSATHPGASLEKKQLAESPPRHDETQQKADLLAALDAESDE